MHGVRIIIIFSLYMQHGLTLHIENIESLGCWKDSRKDRSLQSLEHKHHFLDGPYSKRTDPIRKCAQVAIDRGFTVFGVQNGGQCFSGHNAEKRYNMYGPSNLCRSGKGGKWSSSIYSTKMLHSRSIHKSSDPSPWDPYCSRDLDIVLLIDGSGPLNKKSKAQWNEIKKFCLKFVKGFDEHARIGIIKYGSEPQIIVDMLKGTKSETIEEQIKTMEMPGGSRTLNDGLKRAWREQLKQSNKTSADKVIIAMTTGDIPYGLYGSSQFLTDHNVRIVAIGIDKMVHYEFLQSIASYRDVSNIFSVNSEQLREAAPFIYRDICNNMPEYVLETTPTPSKVKVEPTLNATEVSNNKTETSTTIAEKGNSTVSNNTASVNNNSTNLVNNTSSKTELKPSSNSTVKNRGNIPKRQQVNKHHRVYAYKKQTLPSVEYGTVFDVGTGKAIMEIEEAKHEKLRKKNLVTAVRKGAAKEDVASMVLVNPSPELNLDITEQEAKEIKNRNKPKESEDMRLINSLFPKKEVKNPERYQNKPQKMISNTKKPTQNYDANVQYIHYIDTTPSPNRPSYPSVANYGGEQDNYIEHLAMAGEPSFYKETTFYPTDMYGTSIQNASKDVQQSNYPDRNVEQNNYFGKTGQQNNNVGKNSQENSETKTDQQNIDAYASTRPWYNFDVPQDTKNRYQTNNYDSGKIDDYKNQNNIEIYEHKNVYNGDDSVAVKSESERVNHDNNDEIFLGTPKQPESETSGKEKPTQGVTTAKPTDGFLTKPTDGFPTDGISPTKPTNDMYENKLTGGISEYHQNNDVPNPNIDSEGDETNNIYSVGETASHNTDPVTDSANHNVDPVNVVSDFKKENSEAKKESDEVSQLKENSEDIKKFNNNDNTQSAKTFVEEGKKGADSKINGVGAVTQSYELHQGNGKQHVSYHPSMHETYANVFTGGKLSDRMKSHQLKPMFGGRDEITYNNNQILRETQKPTLKFRNLTGVQNVSDFMENAGSELAEIYDKVHKLESINAKGDISNTETPNRNKIENHEQNAYEVLNSYNGTQHNDINSTSYGGPSVFEMDKEEQEKTSANMTGNNTINAMKDFPNDRNLGSWDSNRNGKRNATVNNLSLLNNANAKQNNSFLNITQGEQNITYQGSYKNSSSHHSNIKNSLPYQGNAKNTSSFQNNSKAYFSHYLKEKENATVDNMYYVTQLPKNIKTNRTVYGINNISPKYVQRTNTSKTFVYPNVTISNTSFSEHIPRNTSGDDSQTVVVVDSGRKHVTGEKSTEALPSAKYTPLLKNDSQIVVVTPKYKANLTALPIITDIGNTLFHEDRKIPSYEASTDEKQHDKSAKKEDVVSRYPVRKIVETDREADESVSELVGAVEEVSKDAAELGGELATVDRRNYKFDAIVGGDYNEGMGSFDSFDDDEEKLTKKSLQARKNEIDRLLKILDKEDTEKHYRNSIGLASEVPAFETGQTRQLQDGHHKHRKNIHKKQNNHKRYYKDYTQKGFFLSPFDYEENSDIPLKGNLRIDDEDLQFITEEMNKTVFDAGKHENKASKKFDRQVDNHISADQTGFNTYKEKVQQAPLPEQKLLEFHPLPLNQANQNQKLTNKQFTNQTFIGNMKQVESNNKMLQKNDKTKQQGSINNPTNANNVNKQQMNKYLQSYVERIKQLAGMKPNMKPIKQLTGAKPNKPFAVAKPNKQFGGVKTSKPFADAKPNKQFGGVKTSKPFAEAKPNKQNVNIKLNKKQHNRILKASTYIIPDENSAEDNATNKKILKKISNLVDNIKPVYHETSHINPSEDVTKESASLTPIVMSHQKNKDAKDVSEIKVNGITITLDGRYGGKNEVKMKKILQNYVADIKKILNNNTASNNTQQNNINNINNNLQNNKMKNINNKKLINNVNNASAVVAKTNNADGITKNNNNGIAKITNASGYTKANNTGSVEKTSHASNSGTQTNKTNQNATPVNNSPNVSNSNNTVNTATSVQQHNNKIVKKVSKLVDSLKPITKAKPKAVVDYGEADDDSNNDIDKVDLFGNKIHRPSRNPAHLPDRSSHAPYPGPKIALDSGPNGPINAGNVPSGFTASDNKVGLTTIALVRPVNNNGYNWQNGLFNQDYPSSTGSSSMVPFVKPIATAKRNPKTIIHNKGPTIGAFDDVTSLQNNGQMVKTYTKNENIQDHMFLNLHPLLPRIGNNFASNNLETAHVFNTHLSMKPIQSKINRHSKQQVNFQTAKTGQRIGIPVEHTLKDKYHRYKQVLTQNNKAVKSIVQNDRSRQVNKIYSKKNKPIDTQMFVKAPAKPDLSDASSTEFRLSKPIGSGIKPLMNTHIHPVMIPHSPPGSPNLFKHVRKSNLFITKTDTEPIQTLEMARANLQAMANKQSVWTEVDFIAKTGKPFARNVIRKQKQHSIATNPVNKPKEISFVRPNKKHVDNSLFGRSMASKFKNLLLASDKLSKNNETYRNLTKSNKRLNNHHHKRHKKHSFKAYVIHELEKYNKRKGTNLRPKDLTANVIKAIAKNVITRTHIHGKENIINSETKASSYTSKKTVLDMLSKPGRPITEEDVTADEKEKKKLKTKSEITSENDPLEDFLVPDPKHTTTRKVPKINENIAKKQSITDKPEDNEFDILNLDGASITEAKKNKNDENIISEDDMQRRKQVSSKDKIAKNTPSKAFQIIGHGKSYLLETTPSMSKQALNDLASEKKELVNHEPLNENDFPHTFLISEFHLEDLPALPDGKSYVLSTPALGAVTVKIKSEKTIEHPKVTKKNHYFREIEELPEEELQKHNYEFYETSKEKDLSDAIQNNVKHDKSFFSPLKAAKIYLNDNHRLIEMPKGVLYGGEKFPSIVTFVDHPVSRHKEHKNSESRDEEQLDEQITKDNAKAFLESDPEIHNIVEVSRLEDSNIVNGIKAAEQQKHGVPDILPDEINDEPEKTTQHHNKSTDGDSLLTMVHNVLKDSAQESKIFLRKKKKVSNDTSIIKTNNDKQDSSAIIKTSHPKKVIENNDKSKTKEELPANTNENQSLGIYTFESHDNKPTILSSENQFTLSNDSKQSKHSDNNKLSTPSEEDKSNKNKIIGMLGTEKDDDDDDDNEITTNRLTPDEIPFSHMLPRHNKSLHKDEQSDDELGSKNIDKLNATKYEANFNSSNNSNNTNKTNKNNYNNNIKNITSNNVTSSNSSYSNVSNNSITDNNKTAFSNKTMNTNSSVIQSKSTAKANTPLTNNKTEELRIKNNNTNDNKNNTSNNTNNHIQNTVNSTKNETHATEAKAIKSIEKQDNKTLSDEKKKNVSEQVTLEHHGESKDSVLNDNSTLLSGEDPMFMTSLEYTLGCNKPLRVLYAIDVSDGLGEGPVREKRWRRLKEFINNINSDVIHGVRHHYMVYNVEPRFLNTLDKCDKQTEYFTTADECLCKPGVRNLNGNGGCSVNMPTQEENVEDWGRDGPLTGQALKKARKYFFSKRLNKYKNIIFLISHKDSADRLVTAENELKRDGISLVDIELGDRHDLKRRDYISHHYVRYNIYNSKPHASGHYSKHHNERYRRNHEEEGIPDEHKMKISLLKLQTTLRNIVGKVCKSQTEEEESDSKKSEVVNL